MLGGRTYIGELHRADIRGVGHTSGALRMGPIVPVELCGAPATAGVLR